MNIDSNISQRIEMLRFPLIVGIVFIHMHTADVQFSTSNQNIYAMLTEYISEILARISVPLFFAISGYLFFFSLLPTLQNYLKKLQSRAYTLLIPFLFWNMVIFLFYLMAQNIPFTATYFSGERPIVVELTFLQNMELFFGIGEFKYPVSYQFWFIRDLILLALLTPLIFIAIRVAPYLFLLIVAIVWFFELMPALYLSLDSTSLFFFSLGAYWGHKKFDFSLIDRGWLALLLLFSLFSLIDLFTERVYVTQLTIFLGTLALFSLTSVLNRSLKIKQNLIYLSQYSFFTFAIHEPLLSVIRKLSFIFMKPESDLAIFLVYLFCPILTVSIAIFIYIIVLKWSPDTIQFITGGRN